LKKILAYFAVSFVVLTAVQSVWSFLEYHSQQITNVYVISIKENVELLEVQNAVQIFIQENPEKCTINLYSKYSEDFHGYIIGANEFLHPIWSSHIYEDDLIYSDEAYIWMGSDYWSPYETIEFPIEVITLNETQYLVAGSCNMSILFIDHNRDIDDMYGVSSSSMTIPLKTFLANNLPIKGIVLFFERSPSNSAYFHIVSSFQNVSDGLIIQNPSFILMGIASPIVIVCVGSIFGGLIFIGIETYMTLRQSRIRQHAMRINGATRRRLVLEELGMHATFSTIAFILAIVPSKIVHWIDQYAYQLTTTNLFVVWIVYIALALIVQTISISAVVRKNHRL
jgi:hypothetical protein